MKKFTSAEFKVEYYTRMLEWATRENTSKPRWSSQSKNEPTSNFVIGSGEPNFLSAYYKWLPDTVTVNSTQVFAPITSFTQATEPCVYVILLSKPKIEQVWEKEYDAYKELLSYGKVFHTKEAAEEYYNAVFGLRIRNENASNNN